MQNTAVQELPQDLQAIKEALCEVCHLMWQQGWVAGNDGNVSVRLGANAVLCTPSGVSKREMTPDMLIVVDFDSHILVPGSPDKRPSTELSMHLRCYLERSDVHAVVHAHPPMATAFAVADKAIDDNALIESVLVLGAVPVTPFAMPGTDEVPEAIAPYLAHHDALLLRAHGALTVGHDLRTAYYHMESLEHMARISLIARLLGGAKSLDPSQIEALLSRRQSFYKLPGRHPGMSLSPKASDRDR